MRIWLRDEDSGRDVLLGEQADEPPSRIELVDTSRRVGESDVKIRRSMWKRVSSYGGDHVYEQDR